MIRLDRVSFGYGGIDVLNDVSLWLQAGWFTALVGPNGAGKSTMLRLCSGDFFPDSGDVFFQGRITRIWKPRFIAPKRAFLPQNSQLDFSFSVEEVVMLGRLPHVRSSERERDVRIAREALEMTGMAGFSSRDYTTLSGGERQRVQLARVLAQVWARENCALLLDEPVANLDPAHQHEALAIARDWARSGACVVAILHDLNLALTYADHVVVMQNGGIAASGPTREVIVPDLVERVFGVRAKMLRDENGGSFIATFSAR